MKNNVAWLRGMHLALALMIPLALTFLLSCKRAKEEKADLGPEVPASEIDATLSKAIGRNSLSGLKVGDYVYYSVVRRLENSESTITLGSLNVTAIAARDNDAGTQTKFTLQIDKSFRQESGSFQTVTSEESLVVDKPVAVTPLLSARSSGDLAAYAAALRAAAGPGLVSAHAAAAAKPKRVTFHKLKSYEGTLPAPERVARKADCGGLSPCEIPVTIIRFDMVAWYTDDDYQRISLDFAFSSKTPFLPFGQDFELLSGSLVVDCRSTYVPVEGRKVYVRDCQQIDDLQK